MGERPVILLTNDDGIRATGLVALRNALTPLGQVVVVAPLAEQSACSHSVTLQRPLRYDRHEPDTFSVDGTPADCVYLALFAERFLPRRPDLVLSGINHGVNLGTDVFYSGTVAGAREAAFRGIPAIAFSHELGEPEPDIAALAEVAREMALRLYKTPITGGQAPLLNVNFPRGPFRGARTTHLARRVYQDRVISRTDPYGAEYLWLGGRPAICEQTEGSDVDAVNKGFVSVTPLALEATDTAQLPAAARVAEVVEGENTARRHSQGGIGN